MRRWLSLFFATFSMYIVTHLIVFALLPVACALALLERETALQRLKQTLFGTLFRIIGKKVSVTDLQNAAPGKDYLIVSNYPSAYTIFALMRAFPDAATVAHAFISKIPVFGRLLKLLGTIFVDPKRIKYTRQAIDGALKDESRDIVIFPEGKRSPDGQIAGFQRGFVYILRNSSLDLLPVTANGFYTLKPANRFYLDPAADLELIIHRPIRNSEIGPMTDEEVIQLVGKTIKTVYRP